MPHSLSAVRCDEENCGEEIPFGLEYQSKDVVVAASGIRSKTSGKGVFAVAPLKPKEKIGYFGGRLHCTQCVKALKIGRKKSSFVLLSCGATIGMNGEPVLFYLCRTNIESIDGIVWFINSVRKKYHDGERNCEIVIEGFGEDGKPLVCIETSTAIQTGQELLLDYMNDV